MKINREKLNALLKSGLNPEVKTRKQLAEKLDLDPTSLTRWFATRDRLGNPRYPVVPDRHLNNILLVFNLAPECFALDDEEFHRYCFELAAQRQDSELSDQKKLLTRQDKVERRRLTIPMSPMRRRRVTAYVSFATVVICLGLWFIWEGSQSSDISEPLVIATNQEECWGGFAQDSNEFDYDDASDPCHYRKLMHKALKQLKAQNRDNTGAREVTVDATGDYIAFLSEKLNQRHEMEKAVLNYELGRSALQRGNYTEALTYLQRAKQGLNTLENDSPELKNEVEQFILEAENAVFADQQVKNQ